MCSRVVKACLSDSKLWLNLVLNGGRELSIPSRWLFEIHPSNFDPFTKQRFVPCNKDTGKVLQTVGRFESISSFQIEEDGRTLNTQWLETRKGDGENVVSSSNRSYSVGWLLKEIERSRESSLSSCNPQLKCSNKDIDYNGQTLWSGLIDSDLRGNEMSMSYKDIVNGYDLDAIEKLYKYGILLLKDTPTNTSDDTNKNAIIRMSEIFGHGPQKTLYGSVWSTKYDEYMDEGSSTADSAYSNKALPLHTDMTYYHNPPGLQIFCMTQSSTSGGESVFADGFSIGEKLRLSDIKSFQTLASTKRRYISIDQENGWHLEMSAEAIQCHSNGAISCIRLNDLDRLPDLCPVSKCHEEFYKGLDMAHSMLNQLLNDDENRLIIRLEPGETVVVANQVRIFSDCGCYATLYLTSSFYLSKRCMHARHSFKSSRSSPRTVTGCYVR